MAKDLRFSRWRRLPGVHRISEHKLSTHRAEPQRLTLYVPGAWLDVAEELAARAGTSDVPAYCASLLAEALARADAERRGEVPGLVAGAIASLDELIEVEGVAAPGDFVGEPVGGAGAVPRFRFVAPGSGEGGGEEESDRPVAAGAPAWADAVARHAALGGGADPGSFLGVLRSGRPVPATVAASLRNALDHAEAGLRGSAMVERGLALALHRIAHESEVLISQAWPALALDPVTLEAVRDAQARVERLLTAAPATGGGVQG